MAKRGFPAVRVGEVRAFYDEKGQVWGVVRTPRGRYVLKTGADLEEGTAYSSLSEPQNLVEEEILAWGFRHLLVEAQVEPRLEGWSPPGLLFEVYMAPGHLIAYWKSGERDFLEVWWGLGERRFLEREKEPQAWWRLYEEVRRLSRERLDLVVTMAGPPLLGGGSLGRLSTV